MPNYYGDKNSSVVETLGSLNAAVTLDLSNYTSAGYTMAASTLTGSLIVEESYDGGVTWVNGFWVNSTSGQITTSIGFSNPNPAFVRTIVCHGGATHIRVRVSSYTSGTAEGMLFGTNIIAQNLVPYAATNTSGFAPIRCDSYGGIRTACADLCVTNTAASGTGVTLTLPSASSQFHFISYINITKYFTATNAASATPLLVTTTNLPGSPVWTFGQPLGVIGVTETREMSFPSYIKSTSSSTATTIVCPATTGIIWRVTAWYFVSVF